METAFAEEFRVLLEREADPEMKVARERGYAAFKELGFPTPKLEDWKYTDVRKAVSENWRIAESSSDLIDAHLLNQFSAERNGFTALNQALGAYRVVRIDNDTSLSEPIELNFEAAEGEAIFPRVIVLAGAGCKATIVETYSSPSAGFTNAAVQLFVAENANITHYRVQRDSVEAFNYGVTEVMLGAGSRYDSTNINLGAGLSRHDIDVKFTAEGGEALVDGLYMLGGSQHHDTHSIIDHTVPNCVSHQSYKGVLNDKSRGVFNGKVFVRANAHGTDAHQSNKNLLLSNDARVDTKPQLEIFNDDVKCAHGATVGQLEEEELFYLLTRGLPENLARNLLTYGFAEEIINKIGIETIKAELDATVLNRLGTQI
ncbi:MAG TPA: Fe-S cluster assembly protein SufD [Pyrinomonadaceae bacterium]|nr:Fe-S cluster assembly protein SufD [Pyrinomonadaceae bacterium]